jgi:hypothetical protein
MSIKNINDLEIFVCACDAYAWIYPYFVHLAGKNLPLRYTLFTETIEGPNFIPVGPGRWDERMKRCLSLLNSRDVIYLQEDFLIQYVNVGLLEKAVQLHRKHNTYITKLGKNYEFKTYLWPAQLDTLKVYIQDVYDKYLLSHQPVAIFDREFFLESLSELTPDASSHEIIGSNWMRSNGRLGVFCVGETHYPNRSDIFTIDHAIRKGELICKLPSLDRD